MFVHGLFRPFECLLAAAACGYTCPPIHVPPIAQVEDMLTTDPSEKFGSTTLLQHYQKIAVEGQEYDPYTTMFSSKKK